MEQYRADYKAQAESIVKSQLVIEKIIETEKIEATDEDLEVKYNDMANAQNKSVDEVKKSVKDKQLSYMKNEIIVKKLFEMLKKENVIK